MTQNSRNKTGQMLEHPSALDIGIEDIQKANIFLKGNIRRTVMRRCPDEFKIPGSEIFLKCENEQLTGSFKSRGALVKMNSLTQTERDRGVIASSAGNHAQGVAFAAKALGVRAHIVMPHTTPIVKVNGTRAHGAEVILHGEVYDDAYTFAKNLEKEMGYTFVHPYQDPYVIAGQATIGLEIFEDLSDVDTVVVPIGGGGIISGIATALKHLRPNIKVIGVVSSQAPAMMQLKNGATELTIKNRLSTIAEGIAVKTPSPLMFDTFISPLVDQIIEVDDNDIAQAIVFLLEKGKTVSEGAGAAGLAALMKYSQMQTPSLDLKLGQKVCVVITGGNIDLNVMAKVIERGLRREHRLARLTVVVDDVPGNLNRITTVMAENRSNILEVYHDRVSPELGIRETRIDLLVETASDEHINQIKSSLRAQGFKILKTTL